MNIEHLSIAKFTGLRHEKNSEQNLSWHFNSKFNIVIDIGDLFSKINDMAKCTPSR